MGKNILICGKGIEKLQEFFDYMLHKPAPIEKDETGFNKPDYEFATVLDGYGILNDPKGVPLNITKLMINTMRRYKNTQANNFDEVERLVNQDIKRCLGESHQEEGNEVKVYSNETPFYGKIRVYIPSELYKNNRKKIDNICIESLKKQNIGEREDSFGNFNYPIYLKFQKAKDPENNQYIPNNYYIHPSVLDEILKLFSFASPEEELGEKKHDEQLPQNDIEVLEDNFNDIVFRLLKNEKKDKDSSYAAWMEMKSPKKDLVPSSIRMSYSQGQRPKFILNKGSSKYDEIISIFEKHGIRVDILKKKEVAEKEPEVEKKDFEILGEENTDYGKKLAFKFKISFDISSLITGELKRLGYMPKRISYSGSGKYLLDLENKTFFDSVIEVFKKHNLNVEELQERGENLREPLKPSREFNCIEFTDMGTNIMKMSIDYRSINADKKEAIKDTIQFTFPDCNFNKYDFSWSVNGDFDQYNSLKRVLDKYSVNTEKLEEIIKNKLKEGTLTRNRLGHIDDKDKFVSKLKDDFPNSSFNLYNEQIKGVKFLYSRNSAILGDSTGTGKTAQLVYAAAMRMKKYGGKTLIITLKRTVSQFENTIKQIVGKNEEVSMDTNNPNRWTVVYYDCFSRRNKAEKMAKEIKDAGYTIVIFDELHALKNKDSNRSQNLEEITSKIPTRWGATASVSSNHPIDVRNQLVLVGHPLGKIPSGRFKQRFAGMVPEGYNNSYINGSPELRISAAEKLNKWLHLSGVYIRREKSDIREMPNISVQDSNVYLDSEKFDKEVAEKVRTYKDPDLAISNMIAQRETLARYKVPYTVRKVIKIVQNNKNKSNPAASRVVIFTNFVESAQQLVASISYELKKVDPKFYVISFLAGNNDTEGVKDTFSNDINCKVLVMSIKVGGTGVDFPNAAQHMVVNDFDWTPESADQSEGRIFRINTNHPVYIDYQVADGVDREMFENVKLKRELAKIIQSYRNEYLDTDSKEVLDKIIKAQLEVMKIDEKLSGTK